MPPRSDRRYEAQDIARLQREVRDLWRAFRTPRRSRFGDPDDVQGFGASDGFAYVFDRDTGLYKPTIPPPMVTFHFQGDLTTDPSDPFWVPVDCKLFLWTVGLSTAGSSTSTLVLKKLTDTSIDSISLASSDQYEPSPIGYAVDAGTGLFVEPSAVGTGAAGAVVSVWAKAA